MLNKEKCLEAIKLLEESDTEYECYWDTIGHFRNPRAIETIDQLINEHFELQLTRSECDLIEFALKPLEEELGMDITLLIDKIQKHKCIAPKEEGVVESVEFEDE